MSGQVLQSGRVTPGHGVSWTTDGVVQDAGYVLPLNFSAPPPIGNSIANAGFFTSLSATGSVLLGTGTLGLTDNYGFQTAFDIDVSTLGGSGNARQNFFNGTLSYPTDSSGIIEWLNSFLVVNGPGIALGEINQVHAYLQVNSGADVQVHENFESSVLNNGIIGTHDAYLDIFTNGPTGTVTYGNGFFSHLVNQNTAAGSIQEWDAISIGIMTGGGSLPTSYNAMRVADANAGIVTLGGINIGSLGQAVSAQLQIIGADESSGTVPFIIKDHLLALIAYATNAGVVDFPKAGVSMTPGGINLLVKGSDNSSGTIAFAVNNLAGDGGLFITNAGVAVFSQAGVTISPDPPNPQVFVQGADNLATSFPLSLKNLAGTGLLAVSNSGAFVIAPLTNATDDAAAALAGVWVDQLYRNGSVVMQRVS